MTLQHHRSIFLGALLAMSIAPVQAALSGLSYSPNPALDTVGVASTPLAPTLASGTATQFKISPALPAGLSLFPSSGTIVGTPSAPATSQTYVVTASNGTDSTQGSFVLSVIPLSAPANLSYGTDTLVFYQGIAGGTSPTWVNHVEAFSITPSLPASLALSQTTGKISGTPTATVAAANYTVTATNATGSTQKILRISVSILPPTALSFRRDSIAAVAGVSIAPDSAFATGIAIQYSVTPPLPNGLSLNSTKGIISGTATAASPLTSYTVSASNTSGTIQTTVKIEVTLPPPPQNLTYTLSSLDLTQGVSMGTLNPTVTGIVTRYRISPALPTGLRLDSITGILSGTPTVARAATSHTVTAFNPGGTTQFGLQISVAPSWVAVTGAGIDGDYGDFYFSDSLTGTVFGGYANGGSSVARTTNGGTSWNGQVANPIWQVQKCSFPTPLVGYIAGVEGASIKSTKMAKTTDGGASWVNIGAAGSGNATYSMLKYITPELGFIRVKSPSADSAVVSQSSAGGGSQLPSHITAVGFATPKIGVALGASGYAQRTTNAGSTWNAFNTGLTATFNAVSCLNGSTCYAAGTNGAIAMSVDTGKTWSSLTSGTSATLNDIRFVNSNVGYAAGASGTILRTANSGLSWAPMSTGKTTAITALSFPTPDIGYALGINFILKYAGSGLATTPLPPAPSALSYRKDVLGLVLNNSITPDSPFVSGTVVSYSVTPSLPAGLALDPVTGIVYGTPTAISPTGFYTVSASNSGGSTQKVLQISVDTVAPPSNLFYRRDTLTLTSGTPIIPDTAFVTGSVSRFTVSPALPAGLVIDSVKGIISGTPSAFADSSSYTVTASNASGSTQKVLRITIKPVGLANTPFGPSLFQYSPATGRLIYWLKEPSPVRIRLINIQGAIVWKSESTASSGTHSVRIPLERLDRSIHVLQFESLGLHRQLRIISLE